MVVTIAPLLPTPSIPYLRSPKSRSAFRLEVVHAANQAGNQAGNLVEIFSVTTPGSPRPGPGRTLPKDDAGSSCGVVLRVRWRMARVPGSAGTLGKGRGIGRTLEI